MSLVVIRLKLDLIIAVVWDANLVAILQKVDLQIKMDVKECVHVDVILCGLDSHQNGNVNNAKPEHILLNMDWVIHVTNYVLLELILQKVDL